ncbi:prepilin peptidase [Nakamurella multipartita]|nr:prepilin peptidase [Nakamurella multipartita]
MLLAVALGALVGALAGGAGRVLLGRLRRGVAVRPPLLEVAAGLVTAAGVALAWPTVIVVLVVWAGLLMVILGAVDIAAHRLPDALTLPALPVTAALVLLTGLLAPPPGGLPAALLTALVAAVVVTGIFAAAAALAPRAMGWGDVKLVPFARAADRIRLGRRRAVVGDDRVRAGRGRLAGRPGDPAVVPAIGHPVRAVPARRVLDRARVAGPRPDLTTSSST